MVLMQTVIVSMGHRTSSNDSRMRNVGRRQGLGCKATQDRKQSESRTEGGHRRAGLKGNQGQAEKSSFYQDSRERWRIGCEKRSHWSQESKQKTR